MANINEVFSSFQDYMDKEFDKKEEIRGQVRELEQRGREILAVLQSVHHLEGVKNVASLCQRARVMLGEAQAGFTTLAASVPAAEYYRFHDHWRFITQRLCFLSSLVHFLETETLATRQQCAHMIGVKVEREEGFHLDLDDYLMGLLNLASELSRLAINAVTAGDYNRPKRIARFLGDLDAGFRLLNLKNDALRKRFDGLKYDIQKVEGVVYDVEIRGLAKSADETKAMIVEQGMETTS